MVRRRDCTVVKDKVEVDNRARDLCKKKKKKRLYCFRELKEVIIYLFLNESWEKMTEIKQGRLKSSPELQPMDHPVH